MKKIILIFVPLFLHAVIGPSGFFDYRNEYFVETGTNGGGGLLSAVRAGFRKIFSIEIDEQHIPGARELLKRYSFVNIVQGDSSILLWEIIKDIQRPITFFLDAHRFPPVDDGMKNCPLLEELEQIKRHSIKTHTILIDDMSCCGTLSFDFITKDDLIAKLLEINPHYQISYITGGSEGEAPENIMVAKLLRKR